MAQIFISYSRQDADFARRLATDLDGFGADVWIDVEDIPPGVKWSTAVQQGLDACHVLILIMSPDSIASTNVEDEWQYARDERKPIIPILWRPIDQMPFQLRRIQYINFHNQPYESGLRQLHARLLDHDSDLDDLPTPNPSAGNRITFDTLRQLTFTRALTGHRDSVKRTAFSPDSTLIASCSDDRTVRLWYTAQRTRIKMMIGHEKAVNAVVFSPSGSFLASASDDRTVRLWHVAKRYGIGALRGHTGPVTDVAYSPTETLLASSSEDGTVRLWDARQRALAATLEQHRGPVQAVMFAPDGSALATAGSDLRLHLWDIVSRTVLTSFALPDEARSIAFSPDGSLLALGLADQGVLVLAVERNALPPSNSSPASDSEPVTLSKIGQIFYADYNARCIRGVAFSPDGTLLALAALDGTIRVWKVADLRHSDSGRALKVLRGHEGGVMGLAFSPDGAWLVSASHDNTLRLWSSKT